MSLSFLVFIVSRCIPYQIFKALVGTPVDVFSCKIGGNDVESKVQRYV